MVQAEPLHPVSREPLVDGLRMLALAGVLVVNAMSYAVGPYGPLPGVPVPADSWPAPTRVCSYYTSSLVF